MCIHVAHYKLHNNKWNPMNRLNLIILFGKNTMFLVGSSSSNLTLKKQGVRLRKGYPQHKIEFGLVNASSKLVAQLLKTQVVFTLLVSQSDSDSSFKHQPNSIFKLSEQVNEVRKGIKTSEKYYVSHYNVLRAHGPVLWALLTFFVLFLFIWAREPSSPFIWDALATIYHFS